MIKDRNIDPGANIQLSKIAGLGLGPITGETFYVAKDGIQARTWLDGRVPGDHLFLTIDAAINKCVAERGCDYCRTRSYGRRCCSGRD